MYYHFLHCRECVSRLEGEQSEAREFILSCSTEIGELRCSVKEACTFIHTLQTAFRELMPQQLVREYGFLCMKRALWVQGADARMHMALNAAASSLLNEIR